MAIRDEIEMLREKLNQKVSGERSIHSNLEIINLSQKLDELINIFMKEEYLKLKNMR